MVYLDNAATSHFKPKCVYDALMHDLSNSANSGRSGHKLALSRAMDIEKTRGFLLSKFGGENLVFTKNCTEALNLAIFGFLKDGMRVVTTENEHNSVLRPLKALEGLGVITLLIVKSKDGYTPFESLVSAGKTADLVVVTLSSNVNGASNDLCALKSALKNSKAKIFVDGAQGVPYLPFDMSCGDMLALPAHKGLHGIQGVGALIVGEGVCLKPLVYGGTGTESFSPTQPTTMPEGYEAGTLFSGGICAFGAGARWTFDHIDHIRKNVKNLASECAYHLGDMGFRVYSKEFDTGIVTFNVGDTDSQKVASFLDEKDIAVRGGIHCSPLVHKHLGTEKQGAVRVSFGVDNTKKDTLKLLSALECLVKNQGQGCRPRFWS